MEKINKILRFSYFVMKHDVRKGHLVWKISEVAKEVGVSRTWVYKYLGKTKEEILYNSVFNVTEDVYLMSEDRKKIIQEKGIVAFLKGRQISETIPEVFVFHFMHYSRNNRYGKLLRSIEQTYVETGLKKGNNWQMNSKSCLCVV